MPRFAASRSRIVRPFLPSLLCSTALALLPSLADANPAGGQVAAGSASISQSGKSLTVTQQSQKAIINWQSFNIAPGETTNFAQPNAQSITLNRVTGVDPSQILGSLTANGQVWLINPNGIAFGKSARVDVAGLLATTIDIADQDFMSGNYQFSSLTNPSAMVTNAGHITIRDAGLGALVAPGVENSGVIEADLGQIQLSSAAAFTVDFYGDGLFNIALDKQVTQAIRKQDGTTPAAAVTNSGTLTANGGKILLTANAAASVVNNAINMTGYAQATSASQSQDGSITLDGGSDGTVQVAGTLDASGKNTGETGGTVEVTGHDVQLASTAKIDVSGDAGGGAALVGGDMHGNGTLRDASTTTVASGATINADAISHGNGGEAVVWSNDQTDYEGTISAKGGAANGNGGSAEVSSHGVLNFTGLTDLGAAHGISGTLLLDPQDVTIGNSGAWIVTTSAILQSLANGNVQIITDTTESGNGDITVAQSFSWTGSNSLTLSAYRNIVFDSGVTVSNSGSGNLALRADSAGLGTGTVQFQSGSRANWAGSSGIVSIYYDPSGGYTSPTNFGAFVSGRYTAYMLVNTAYDLQNVAANLSGDYALGRNINMAGINFTPIGSGTTHSYGFQFGGVNTGTPFVGIFDGNGHTIDSLTINSNMANVGLFGYIGRNGVVTNLGLTNAQITGIGYGSIYSFDLGDFSVGGLAGTNDGTISNSYVTGSVRSTAAAYNGVGGLVGWNDGSITGSYSAATVSGGYDVGGLVGINGLYWLPSPSQPTQAGSISKSYSTGTVNGIVFQSGDYGESVGGLVGLNYANVPCGSGTGSMCLAATIDQSFATGTVNGGGFNNVGGFAGINDGSISHSYATGAVSNISNPYWNDVGAFVGLENDPDDGFNTADTTANISQSYATGHVSSVSSNTIEYPGVGGFIGLYGGAPGTATNTVLNSYWDTQATGQTVSGGGMGKTTAQLRNSLPSGFDSAIWVVGSNGYPDLRWHAYPATVSVTTLQAQPSGQTAIAQSSQVSQQVASQTASASGPSSIVQWASLSVSGVLAELNESVGLLQPDGYIYPNGVSADLEQECAVLVQTLYPNIGLTSQWTNKRTFQIAPNSDGRYPNLAPGTPIATFRSDGTYPSGNPGDVYMDTSPNNEGASKLPHSAIFLGYIYSEYDPTTGNPIGNPIGMYILDQSDGHPAAVDERYFTQSAALANGGQWENYTYTAISP